MDLLVEVIYFQLRFLLCVEQFRWIRLKMKLSGVGPACIWVGVGFFFVCFFLTQRSRERKAASLQMINCKAEEVLLEY